MSRYYQKLCGLVRKAIVQYDMIQLGDRIAVGVSGGKDSVALTMAMNSVRKYMGIDFKIVAITLDPRFGGIETDYASIENLFKAAGIDYKIKCTDIGEIVFEERNEQNPCSLCRRMRRGALHDFAKENNCNKIALGHHLDDAIETFYMNLWNEGRLGTFSPVTYLSRKDITMIRPLVLAVENEVIAAVREQHFPIVKSNCPKDGFTERQRIKEFVISKCKKDPAFRKKNLNAFQKKDLDGWGIKLKPGEKS
jgi:tRNA 2-thiocytidine biosynthesis protein TtcA